MRVCLLYAKKFKDEKINLLQQHYKKNHEVDVNYFFYNSLVKKEKGVLIPNKCATCEYFYMNSRDKKNNNTILKNIIS